MSVLSPVRRDNGRHVERGRRRRLVYLLMVYLLLLLRRRRRRQWQWRRRGHSGRGDRGNRGVRLDLQLYDGRGILDDVNGLLLLVLLLL